MLGLHPPRETITIEDKSQIDLDWVAHDVRKFARMMTNHNGYVLEQLFSPLVVVSSPAFDELRELGRGCITRPTVRHYLGFAQGLARTRADRETLALRVPGFPIRYSLDANRRSGCQHRGTQ